MRLKMNKEELKECNELKERVLLLENLYKLLSLTTRGYIFVEEDLKRLTLEELNFKLSKLKEDEVITIKELMKK
jgi:hypothetical protein